MQVLKMNGPGAAPQVAAPVRFSKYVPVADTHEQDNRFVRGCQNGNAADWEELVKRHTRRVYGICFRFTRRDCEAQDLTQEVFIRVFRTLGSFRSEEYSFVAWLNMVTRNLLVDHYRSVRKERLTVSINEQPMRFDSFATADHRPDRAAATTETSRILHSALTRLAPDLREMVVLYDVLSVPYREIAERLGIPVGTVKSRLNRARAMMAHLLRGYKLAA
jgi:RNA polymerase sigma-70 factor (ECF subfamily)